MMVACAVIDNKKDLPEESGWLFQARSQRLKELERTSATRFSVIAFGVNMVKWF